jgi:hypothetical protein
MVKGKSIYWISTFHQFVLANIKPFTGIPPRWWASITRFPKLVFKIWRENHLYFINNCFCFNDCILCQNREFFHGFSFYHDGYAKYRAIQTSLI